MEKEMCVFTLKKSHRQREKRQNKKKVKSVTNLKNDEQCYNTLIPDSDHVVEKKRNTQV